MTSDSNHVRDEEIVTVRGEEPAETSGLQDVDAGDQTGTGDATDQADIADVPAPSGATDTGVMMDPADTGTADLADVPAPSGATDTGVMMDSRDTGTADLADVPAPSGATDTGAMMDPADTGSADATDADESER